MINDINSIVQLGGQVVIVFVFIAYLRHKDTTVKDIQKDFIQYIEKHSDNGNLISAHIQKFTDVIEELKNLVKELTLRIEQQTNTIEERDAVNHKLYERILDILQKK